MVRLPDGLRADIEAAANASDRSMNSVFIQAVRQYLDGQNRQTLLLEALANAGAPLPDVSSGPVTAAYVGERLIELFNALQRRNHLRPDLRHVRIVRHRRAGCQQTTLEW